MKTDRYTRVVLTVIAACLVALVVDRFANPPSASAEQATPVYLVGINGRNGLPVRIVGGQRGTPGSVMVTESDTTGHPVR